MSDEDQVHAIGRLILERSDINRQRALLKSAIDRFSVKLGYIAHGLGTAGMSPRPKDDAEMNNTLSTIDELISNGNLEKLKALVAEYLSHGEKLVSIEQTLKEAGVE